MRLFLALALTLTLSVQADDLKLSGHWVSEGEPRLEFEFLPSSEYKLRVDGKDEPGGRFELDANASPPVITWKKTGRPEPRFALAKLEPDGRLRISQSTKKPPKDFDEKSRLFSKIPDKPSKTPTALIGNWSTQRQEKTLSLEIHDDSTLTMTEEQRKREFDIEIDQEKKPWTMTLRSRDGVGRESLTILEITSDGALKMAEPKDSRDPQSSDFHAGETLLFQRKP